MSSVSCFDFLGSGASEMLSSQQGIELGLSALEGEVLTTGLPRKPPELCFSSSGFCLNALGKERMPFQYAREENLSDNLFGCFEGNNYRGLYVNEM